jgi:hypothetical protein
MTGPWTGDGAGVKRRGRLRHPRPRGRDRDGHDREVVAQRVVQGVPLEVAQPGSGMTALFALPATATPTTPPAHVAVDSEATDDPSGDCCMRGDTWGGGTKQ